jgi:hypothetical protein
MAVVSDFAGYVFFLPGIMLCCDCNPSRCSSTLLRTKVTSRAASCCYREVAQMSMRRASMAGRL